MTRRGIRGWYLVHKWTSLVCTLFLLMLCLTGLPLIFHDEIDAALGADARAGAHGRASSSEGPGLAPLDAMLATALAKRPGEVPLFMAFDNDGPLTTITTGPRPDAPGAEMTMQIVDRGTGRLVPAPGEGGVTAFLLQLHTDMFLGLKGELFLGAMGALFVASLVSGAVLYAPFMRKLDFGALRTRRSRRVQWLDWHNLLGIVALAWMTVVGVTGVVNALVTPITKAWQSTELARMTRAYAGRAPLLPSRYGSLDRAMATARAAIPGMNPQFIAFPGGRFSSQHHYAVFFQGATPLTERLLTTGADRRGDRAADRRGADAVVLQGAVAVAAAAFRRLRRAADEAAVGGAGPVRDRRARVGRLPLARPPPRPARPAPARAGDGRTVRSAAGPRRMTGVP